MNDERAYGAMPKLYGAPAYARPKVDGIVPTSRPFDPDDLPIEALRDGDVVEPAPDLQPQPYAGADPAEAAMPAAGASEDGVPSLQARKFRLKLPGRSREAGQG